MGNNSYSIIYDCCVNKCKELGIKYKENIQDPKSIDEIYKNFVYHSQNRSKGCAVNFFKLQEKNPKVADEIWKIIENYKFDLKNEYDYINLFNKLKENDYVKKSIKPSKKKTSGKDMQYIGLAKTCQCIKKYLDEYKDLNDFIAKHKFSEDYNKNWVKISEVSDAIYNMGPALVPDFFKEQECIVGREFLVKADKHVKRFFDNISGKDLSEEEIYERLLKLYKDDDTKNKVIPYKLDKRIFLIGKKIRSPKKAKEFAEEVKKECVNIESFF